MLTVIPKVKGFLSMLNRYFNPARMTSFEEFGFKVHEDVSKFQLTLKDDKTNELSLPYLSAAEFESIIIKKLAEFGVERECIRADADLVDDIGISRFDILVLIEAIEYSAGYTMYDEYAVECRSIRDIAFRMNQVLEYDKVQQCHKGPYYHPSDYEFLWTLLMQVENIPYRKFFKEAMTKSKARLT